MSYIIYNIDGDIVRRSRNLRGILDHARRSPVVRATISANTSFSGYYTAQFHYANGDIGAGPYADPTVFRQFIRARRSWGLAEASQVENDNGLLPQQDWRR